MFMTDVNTSFYQKTNPGYWKNKIQGNEKCDVKE